MPIEIIFLSLGLIAGFIAGWIRGLKREERTGQSLAKSGLPSGTRDFNPIPQPKTYQVRTQLFPGRAK